MAKTTIIQTLLTDLENQLRAVQCWDAQAPAAEALASTTPFAADSLEFCQWLQWVFIPKIQAMLEQGPLPAMACGIAPMAEEWIKVRGIRAAELIACLAKLDTALSR